MATSLSLVSKRSVTPAQLSAAMIDALVNMDRIVLTAKEDIMHRYRKNCITLGQDICVIGGEETCYGTAVDVDADGGLIVRFADGTIKTVTSGEVSVRGMYGYIS